MVDIIIDGRLCGKELILKHSDPLFEQRVNAAC